jgi:hypothetical protein
MKKRMKDVEYSNEIINLTLYKYPAENDIISPIPICAYDGKPVLIEQGTNIDPTYIEIISKLLNISTSDFYGIEDSFEFSDENAHRFFYIHAYNNNGYLIKPSNFEPMVGDHDPNLRYRFCLHDNKSLCIVRNNFDKNMNRFRVIANIPGLYAVRVECDKYNRVTIPDTEKIRHQGQKSIHDTLIVSVSDNKRHPYIIGVYYTKNVQIQKRNRIKMTIKKSEMAKFKPLCARKTYIWDVVDEYYLPNNVIWTYMITHNGFDVLKMQKSNADPNEILIFANNEGNATIRLIADGVVSEFDLNIVK